jgi:hypothetical protein
MELYQGSDERVSAKRSRRTSAGKILLADVSLRGQGRAELK